MLGAHFSIAGGLHRALEEASHYGCNTLQLFTKNATTWKERSLTTEEIIRFREESERRAIRSLCSHAAYLINLASPDEGVRSKSRDALANELVRAAQLAIPVVVIHPGAHMGTGEKKGLQRIASSVRDVLDSLPQNPCRVLLETTAGQGTSLGHTFDQLATLDDLIDRKERVGFCLDTCHVFAAGYDLRTTKSYRATMAAFNRIVGLGRLFVIHLNDANKGLGSHIDRHAHIGQGAIGIEAFRLVMNDPRLNKIPKIIETPKKKGAQDCDRINLDRLRSLLAP